MPDLRQVLKFEYGSEAEAIELRKQAIDMPDGIRRDDLLRIARQIELVANLDKSLRPDSALRP
jgi:hypothetical protein